LAGNPFGVDRQFLASELGMIGGVCPNSMDAVSDRDYALETMFFAATHMIHLSRWAEDMIIYSSGQYRFVQCSDAYATGELHRLSAVFSNGNGTIFYLNVALYVNKFGVIHASQVQV
jgi:Lyase